MIENQLLYLNGGLIMMSYIDTGDLFIVVDLWYVQVDISMIPVTICCRDFL